MSDYLKMIESNLRMARVELENSLAFPEADHLTLEEIREEIKVMEAERNIILAELANKIQVSHTAKAVLHYANDWRKTGDNYSKRKACEYAAAIIAGGNYDAGWPNTWLAYHRNEGVK